MVFTKKQLKILEFFTKSPFNELTYKQIKLNQKSNNFLTKTLNNFHENKIITKKKISNLNLYKLNLNEIKTINYLEILNNYGLDTITKNTIKIIINEIKSITPFFGLVIFGSYVSHSNKKNSDIDLLILVEKYNDRIQTKLNNAKLKSLIKIDAHIITKNEFNKMLEINEENLAKEILKKHKTIYNSNIFYDILKLSQSTRHLFLKHLNS